ncbi:Phosphatidylglycerol/phosphatidylinositol transfer protein [Tulasnella sp. 424]|nr:Phosphatidylglycerol/phosphatidylinositol transfer protein [Tulasnella sp. 424]KAG8978606.1 Phosphatidylglycerol/phosphatidylinositol transfer protein [Tulasnella sp. 425]
MRPTFALLAVAASFSSVLAAPSWTGFGLSNDSPMKTMNSWSWEDCGLPTDIVEIQSISVSPDPPEPGQSLTITAIGTAKETIEDGAYADVTVKLGLVKLLSKRFDICEEAYVMKFEAQVAATYTYLIFLSEKANADIQCPVEQGYHKVVQTVDLPKEIPRAKFVVAVRAYSVDDEDLLCANIKVDFMKRPF